ncbi:MAG: hypothetical protein WKH64_06855 [Chloroflexia bacterium]
MSSAAPRPERRRRARGRRPDDHLSGQPTIPLCAQTSGEYYAEVVDLEAAFSRDEMGAVAGVTLRQGRLQFVASKIA